MHIAYFVSFKSHMQFQIKKKNATACAIELRHPVYAPLTMYGQNSRIITRAQIDNNREQLPIRAPYLKWERVPALTAEAHGGTPLEIGGFDVELNPMGFGGSGWDGLGPREVDRLHAAENNNYLH